MKKYELQPGNEIRGMMIRLYPTEEDIETLRVLQSESRRVWNYLVRQTEDSLDASAAYAEREGLVPSKPTRPDYNGMTPEESKTAKALYFSECGAWRKAVYSATKGLECCKPRRFADVLAHFGVKHDYQLFWRVIGWSLAEGEEVKSGASVLQSLCKNYFQKSARRKKFRKKSDPMPLQTRSGDCFELGEFGTRGKKLQTFYNCRVKFNGLKIRGRLPGKLPEGRVLEGVTIREEADGWWASIKQEVPKRVLSVPEPLTIVGVDVGLDNLAAMSDGTIVENERGRELSDKIAARQQIKKDVGRLHLQAKRHIMHKIYNEILKPLERVETIVIENLDGDIGQRGSRKVSAMRKIAEMLKQRFGERVREVEPQYTSQTCSQCEQIDKESWSYDNGSIGKCKWCGHEEHRDVNAARNIARKAMNLQVAA